MCKVCVGEGRVVPNSGAQRRTYKGIVFSACAETTGLAPGNICLVNPTGSTFLPNPDEWMRDFSAAVGDPTVDTRIWVGDGWFATARAAFVVFTDYRNLPVMLESGIRNSTPDESPRLRPRYDSPIVAGPEYVLTLRSERPDERTAGSLILPDIKHYKPRLMPVVSTGARIEGISVGDLVLTSQRTPITWEKSGAEYAIVPAHNILSLGEIYD